MELIFAIIGVGAMVCLTVLGAIWLKFFLGKRYVSYDALLANRTDLVELFTTLDFIILTETNIYEQILETNSNTNWAGLSNSEFLNIYRDLSMRCLKAVSDNCWRQFELYMSRQTVQTYVTQKVMKYLTDKVEDSGEV